MKILFLVKLVMIQMKRKKNLIRLTRIQTTNSSSLNKTIFRYQGVELNIEMIMIVKIVVTIITK